MKSQQIAGILRESAVESFFITIAFTFVGAFALGIVGTIWHKMTPTLPPWSRPHTQVERDDATSHIARHSPAFHFSRNHRFGALYAVVFGLTASIHLAARSRNPAVRGTSTLLRHFYHRLAANWFDTFVLNAVGCFVLAIATSWASNFSLSQMLLRWLVDHLHAVMFQAASLFIDAPNIATAKSLIHWYNANVLKFTFWMLYSAAIADDLGLPNLKTLARWIRARAFADMPKLSRLNPGETRQPSPPPANSEGESSVKTLPHPAPPPPPHQGTI